MKKLLCLVVLLLGAGVCLAGNDRITEGYVQIEPGVYEKLGSEGEVFRQGHGLDGVNYLLRRIDTQIEALPSERTDDEERLYWMLLRQRLHFEEIQIRLELQSITKAKRAGCICYDVAKFARVELPPTSPGYYIASAWGGSCGSTTYAANVESVSVDSSSTKFEDCDSDSGSMISVSAAAPVGYNSRCIHGFAENWVSYNSQYCVDDYLWEEKDAGDYQEECTVTCW